MFLFFFAKMAQVPELSARFGEITAMLAQNGFEIVGKCTLSD